MNQQHPFTEPPTHITNLRDLTVILIKHYGFHEGLFQLAVGFRIGVGQVPTEPANSAGQLPGAFVGVENVSLIPLAKGTTGSDVVDAAIANPLPSIKDAKKPSAKKAAKKIPKK